MRVRFSASDTWIEQVVDACPGEVAAAPATPLSRRVSAVVASICRHDAFANHAAFRASVRTAMLQRGTGWTTSQARSVAGFHAAASAQGTGIRYRVDDLRINTPDPYSSSYLAPAASRLRPAIGHLFRALERVPDGVGAALAAYFVLLTIHPFPDGNGRTCRAHFASVVGRWADGPLLVLTLPWLHQDRNRQFHLLAKIARLGDFGPMLRFHAEGIDACRTRFGDRLDALELAVEAGDEPKAQSVMSGLRAATRDLIGHWSSPDSP